jgi:hypothetical protein
VLAAVAGVALAAVVFSEAWHYARFGHLIWFGWHVDLVSEPAAPRSLWGVDYIQSARIRNVTLKPEQIQLCTITVDVAPYEFPVAAFRLERSRDGRDWRASREGLSRCEAGRLKIVTVGPLMSVATARGAFAKTTGVRKDDWIRFVVFSSFDQSAGNRREFVSPPYQLTE